MLPKIDAVLSEDKRNSPTIVIGNAKIKQCLENDN